MKTTDFTVTTTWHNIKRGFYTVQLFAMTLAIPALFYIGVTYKVQAENNTQIENAHQQVVTANTPGTNNNTVNL